MPSSKVEIYNLAATFLGVPRVSSATENTKQAVTFESVWDIVRKRVLRDHKWNCVKARIALNQVSDSPLAGSTTDWSYQYALPSDWLRILTLNGRDNRPGGALWEIELNTARDGHVLLTDEAAALIEYIPDVENTGVYDSQLSAALALELARLTAPSFGKQVAEVDATARLLMIDAKSVDGQEGSPPEIRSDVLIKARLS